MWQINPPPGCGVAKRPARRGLGHSPSAHGLRADGAPLASPRRWIHPGAGIFHVRTSLLLAALAGLAAVPVVGCDRPDRAVAAKAGTGDAAVPTDPVVEVEVDRVRRGAILQRISAPGTLVAQRESRIGAQVRGRIERIFVWEGDRVEAGDPLFQIESDVYELALRQAGARLERAVAERRQLESDLARARKLRHSDVVAEQRIEELETGLAVARAAVREAEEMVALARRDLEQTLVRAPYAASVAARLEDEGTTALVQPQTIVVVLQEATTLEAQATIPEVHFAAIQVGDATLLHVEGLPTPIATEVSAVSDAIDPATRTYLVKMEVDNRDHRLKAGIFARVEIFPRAKDDVLLVAREAVRREDGRTYVLGVRDERAVAVPVSLGVVSEDAVEVLHGVSVDELVIVGDAARTLGPGMRVRPIPASARAPGP